MRWCGTCLGSDLIFDLWSLILDLRPLSVGHRMPLSQRTKIKNLRSKINAHLGRYHFSINVLIQNVSLLRDETCLPNQILQHLFVRLITCSSS